MDVKSTLQEIAQWVLLQVEKDDLIEAQEDQLKFANKNNQTLIKQRDAMYSMIKNIEKYVLHMDQNCPNSRDALVALVLEYRRRVKSCDWSHIEEINLEDI